VRPGICRCGTELPARHRPSSSLVQDLPDQTQQLFRCERLGQKDLARSQLEGAAGQVLAVAAEEDDLQVRLRLLKPIFFFSFNAGALPTTGYGAIGFHPNGYIAQSFTPNRSKILC